MSKRLADLRDPNQEWIPGAVEYHRWHRLPWTEKAVMGVMGEVRVVSSEQAVGFTISGDNQANWIALVKGPSGVVVAIPGCQVAGIAFDAAHGTNDYEKVP